MRDQQSRDAAAGIVHDHGEVHEPPQRGQRFCDASVSHNQQLRFGKHWAWWIIR